MLVSEQELQRALRSREFVLYYQPVYTLSTNRVEGLEALIRWIRSDGVMVPARDFLSRIVDSGLIIPLGRWIFQEACERFSEWRRINPRLYISVNLSLDQLKQPDFVDNLRFISRESGVEPDSVCLEISESVFPEEPDLLLERACALNELGFRLAIDDFGTGYSSMKLLYELPLNVLKIDQSVVAEIGEQNKERVVGSIMDLADNFVLQVVAEGIENTRQLAMLQSLGCQFGQGYFLKPPVPAQDVPQLLSG
jgi:EAL domain-containing protein (putative c-di-GMP-specific phosphodiesterase class I)